MIFHGKIAKMHILAQFEPKVGAGIARGDTKFSILQRYSIANWAQYWAKMCILARLSRFWGPLGQNYELSAHSGAESSISVRQTPPERQKLTIFCGKMDYSALFFYLGAETDLLCAHWLPSWH